jgi:CheY-like chemotaxis protein
MTAATTRGQTSILVVDDESLIRLMTAVVLDEDGYHVDTAAGGAEAIEEIRRQAPDLIVLDLHMPEVDGRDVIHACRGDPETRHVPIVVVSADYRGWPDLDIQAFLAKPYDIDHLSRTIERVLRSTASG